MRILLTGARAPVTLDLARRFHAAGHAVFLADSLRLGLARWSRAVRGMRRVPAPVDSAAKYAEALLAAVRRWKIDLLIPMCEEVYFLARHRDLFQGACRVFADSLDKLERLHNKWKFSQAAYSRHALTPESHLLADAAHLQPFLAESTRWVFKPVYSRFAAQTKIGPTPAEASAIQPTPSRPWIAQRLIVGQEYSSYSVAREGRLLAHAVYRSGYRVGPGSGIYFIACDHPAIEAFARDVVAAENYTGQIGFDFIQNEQGQVRVLEANPRATSGLHLFAPGDGLADLFLGREEFVRPSPAGPCMLGFAMSVWGLAEAFRRGRPLDFARDFWRARDAVFQWRDPLPALLLPLAFAEIVAVALRQRRQLTQAATYDIEWNGEPL